MLPPSRPAAARPRALQRVPFPRKTAKALVLVSLVRSFSWCRTAVKAALARASFARGKRNRGRVRRAFPTGSALTAVPLDTMNAQDATRLCRRAAS